MATRRATLQQPRSGTYTKSPCAAQPTASKDFETMKINFFKAASTCMALGAVLGIVSSSRAQGVWIEAQNHAQINLQHSDKTKVEVAGWGNTEFLSGKNWLQINVEAGNVEANVPAEG